MNNIIKGQKNKLNIIKRDYGNYLYTLQNNRNNIINGDNKDDIKKMILILNRFYFINQQMESLHDEIENGLMDFRKMKNYVNIPAEMKEKIKIDAKNEEIKKIFLPMIIDYCNKNDY